MRRSSVWPTAWPTPPRCSRPSASCWPNPRCSASPPARRRTARPGSPIRRPPWRPTWGARAATTRRTARCPRRIERVGLEDAGELMALATTEQLLHVFDETLWTSAAPGRDERLDPERFAVWLEVMLE